MSQKILLAGHRGNCTHGPENTMAAFEQALSYGVDMIETDIHMSKDGTLFLIHDPTLDRTTNGTGFTHETTWTQLKSLDAGSWYSPEYAGATLPLLDEFLTFMQKYPNLWVNWELKDYPENTGLAFARACAQRLIAKLEEYNVMDRSILNSFSAPVLEYADQLACHRLPIHGQGIAPTSRMKGQVARSPQSYWTWACLYGQNQPLADQNNFNSCKALGIRPCVCIADEEELYLQALDRGCEMFTSNDPKKAAGILKKLGVR